MIHVINVIRPVRIDGINVVVENTSHDLEIKSSTWDDRHVILKLPNGVNVTYKAEDLISAIRNAQNTSRF